MRPYYYYYCYANVFIVVETNCYSCGEGWKKIHM